ncbi:hypothetical protein OW511_23495, partial [Klebsiella pneumoniae]
VLPENPASYRVVRTKSYLFNKAHLCLAKKSTSILTHITKMKLFTIIHFLIVIQKHALLRQVEKGSV